MMNNNAAGLHRTARTVLAEAERAPPEWFSEWASWIYQMIGPRPEEKLGTRAHENWNLVALGGLLAWAYFAEQVAEQVEESDAALPVDVSVVREEVLPVVEEPGSLDGPGAQLPESRSLLGETSPGGVKPPTFAVLGPDGQPLVEGYRG